MSNEDEFDNIDSDNESDESRESDINENNYQKNYNFLITRYQNIHCTRNDNLEEPENISCSVCLEEINKENRVKIKCNHNCCYNCIIKIININTTKSRIYCPECRKNISSIELDKETYIKFLENKIKIYEDE